MKIASLALLALSGLSLGGCVKPPDYSTSNCAGYLGCSATQQIGPIRDNEFGIRYLPPDAPGNAPTRGPGLGCGKAVPDNQVPTVVGSPTGYTHFTVIGTGDNLTPTPLPSRRGPRTFWVRVPANYDANKAYPLIYVGQGCGGYQAANTSTLALYKESLGGNEQAIYVALDIPEDHVNMDCYDNKGGLQAQEWEAFQLFTRFVDSNYCVDTSRIYVAGYSTGGWLSNMWGCYFGSQPDPMFDKRKFAPEYHVRAQASVTGGEPDEQPSCGPVAAIWLHDLGDTGNVIDLNKSALSRVGKTNKCKTDYDMAPQAPWHDEVKAIGPGICKRFTDCSNPALPVVFCTTTGLGHASQDSRAIPAFKLFFDQFAPGAVALPPPPPTDGGAADATDAAGTDGAGGAGGASDAGAAGSDGSANG
jgi:poly(3-hydroxybutyrate) depolymerase